MTSYIDKMLKHNLPDITLVYKDIEKGTYIDVALPGDQKIIRTEDKVEIMYYDLALEIKRIHRASKNGKTVSCERSCNLYSFLR